MSLIFVRLWDQITYFKTSIASLYIIWLYFSGFPESHMQNPKSQTFSIGLNYLFTR
jgi:hypothetical protein